LFHNNGEDSFRRIVGRQAGPGEALKITPISAELLTAESRLILFVATS